MYIKRHLRGVEIKNPVFIRYLWVERNKRRDLDNITSFGHKIIQDALVTTGVLEDDGWDEIIGYSDEFAVDKNNPRIEVVIEEQIDER